MAYITKSLKLSVICILLMTAATSCKREKPTQEPGFVNVTIAIPSSPKVIDQTKHGNLEEGLVDESKIKTITFIVFKSATERESYKTVSINNNISSDPMWDVSNLTMRLLLTPGQKTIYAIANWELTPTAEMPNLETNTTIAQLTGVVRTHNGIIPSGVAPVMTGSLSPNIVGGDQDLKIDLTRQIARVDVYPMISANMKALEAVISLEGVKFNNMAQRAYLFPQASYVSPSNLTWNQTDYVAGTTGVKITATTQAEALAAKSYSTSYIPEYFGASTSTAATTLLIKAKYNGTDSYYSIPINPPGGVKTYAVERNHIYEYYVTIQGIGSATSAFNPFDISEPGVANVKCITEIR